jgi:hypothetical protein
MMRSKARPKINHVRRLERTMRNSREVHFQGVGAALRPQLMPASLPFGSQKVRCPDLHLSSMVTFATCNKGVRGMLQFEGGELFRFDAAQFVTKKASWSEELNFKSIETKNAINGFTVCLGRVYHR